MDPVYKDTLRSQQVNLVQDLEPRDIMGHLYEDGIITENDVELISTRTTRRERCHALLSLLPRRGPDAYGCFRNALQETNYTHLLNLLTLKKDDDDQVHMINSTKRNFTACTCLHFISNLNGKKRSLVEFLKRHCCHIFNNVEPKDITAYLFQNRVLSDEDCERIHCGVTRQDRCKCLVSILLNTGPEDTISLLVQSLEIKYMFLAKEMRSSNNDSEFRNQGAVTDNGIKDLASVLPSQYSVVESNDTDNVFGFDGNVMEESHILYNPARYEDDTPIALHPGSVQPFAFPHKKLFLAFNHLSSLINQGKYDTFERASVKLDLKYSDDADMTCLLAYLSASRWLFGNKLDEAKKQINRGLKLVSKTSNPKYFTVELFTAKTRMYITQKKLNKLEWVLDDVKQVIETDPIGCTGRAAGWLYMNDARGKTSQMDLINLNSHNGVRAYNQLFNSARLSFLKAIDNFNQDGGKDGPFGCGYALCRLAILLLRCGDSGSSMDTLIPSSDDVQSAGMYWKGLEESAIPIPKILQVHLFMAKCDYYYRKGNMVRALEQAKTGYKLAKKINMLEFRDHAHNRVQFLNRKASVTLCGTSTTDHEKIMQELLSESDLER